MKPDLGPEYLHAEDLLQNGEWKQYALTIRSTIAPNTVKSADGKLIDKPILEFSETEKRLVLNKINQRLCKCALGSAKPTEWVGKKITLHAARGDWFGQKNVAAIRVRIPEEGAKPFLSAKNFGTDLTGVKQ